MSDRPVDDGRPYRAVSPLRRGHLLLLFVVVSGVRWSMTVGQHRPWIVSDESAQLAVARVVGRAGHWTMADIATWAPGLGLLLAPLAAVVDDPSTMYRVALGVNSVLGGLGAVGFASLVRRTLRPGRFPASFPLLAAGAVTLGPGQLRSSAAVWAEPAVFLTVTMVMVCLVEAWRTSRTSWANGSVLVAATGVLLHHRLLPVLVIAAVVATGLSARRSLRDGLGVGIVAVVAWWSADTVSTLVTERVWTDPGVANTSGSTLRRVADPAGVLIEMIGQLWYLQATSLLLFGVGAVVLTGAALRGHPLVEPPVARLVGSVIGISIATSVVFMTGRTERADFVIYGRYNEAVAGLVTVIGAAATWELVRQGRRWSVPAFSAGASASLLAALVTEHLRGDVLRNAPLARAMVQGIVPFDVGSSGSPVWIALVAVAVAAPVWWSIHRFRNRPRILAAVAVVLVVLGGARVWQVRGGQYPEPDGPSPFAVVDQVVPDGAPIGFELVDGFDQDPDAFRRRRVELNLVQFRLPDRVVVPWWQSGHHPEYLFGAADSQYLQRFGEIVWSDPDLDVVLWRVRPD